MKAPNEDAMRGFIEEMNIGTVNWDLHFIYDGQCIMLNDWLTE